MEKRELLYEGKAKRVYRTDDPESLIVSYKDDATAFNGLKKGRIAGKGARKQPDEQPPDALFGGKRRSHPFHC